MEHGQDICTSIIDVLESYCNKVKGEKCKGGHDEFLIGCSRIFKICSYKIAMEHFKRATQKGCKHSLFPIGVLYKMCDGIIDNKMAKEYLLMAYACGIFEAACELGGIYVSEGDIPNGIKYYTIAANNGMVVAMQGLGYIYGSCTEYIDNKKAMEYYQMIIKYNRKDKNEAVALVSMGQLYIAKYNGSKLHKITDSNLMKTFDNDTATTLEYYMRAEKIIGGNIQYDIYYQIGRIYEYRGECMKAIIYYTRALRDSGSVEGTYALAKLAYRTMRELGQLGTPPKHISDFAKATQEAIDTYDTQLEHIPIERIIVYMEQAVRNKHIGAQYWLGKYYENKGDIKKAIKYYQLAERLNDVKSMLRLGNIYNTHEQYENKTTAIMYYKRCLDYFKLSDNSNTTTWLTAKEALINIYAHGHNETDWQTAIQHVLEFMDIITLPTDKVINEVISECKFIIGMMFYKLHKYDEAFDYLMNAIEEECSNAYWALGVLLQTKPEFACQKNTTRIKCYEYCNGALQRFINKHTNPIKETESEQYDDGNIKKINKGDITFHWEVRVSIGTADQICDLLLESNIPTYIDTVIVYYKILIDQNIVSDSHISRNDSIYKLSKILHEVKHDNETALKYLQKAISSKHIDSIILAGDINYNMPNADVPTVVKYYEMAVKYGKHEMLIRLAKLFLKKTIANNPTNPTDKNMPNTNYNVERARMYLHSAVKNNNTHAMYMLGKTYYNDVENNEKCLKLFIRAYNGGYEKAAYYIGMINYHDKKDITDAIQYLTMASVMETIKLNKKLEVCHLLGIIFLTEPGVCSKVKALIYLQYAHRSGYIQSTYVMALLLLNAKKIENGKRAIKYFKKCIDKDVNVIQSTLCVGYMYERMNNKNNAIKYYTNLMMNGFTDIKPWLLRIMNNSINNQ